MPRLRRSLQNSDIKIILTDLLSAENRVRNDTVHQFEANYKPDFQKLIEQISKDMHDVSVLKYDHDVFKRYLEYVKAKHSLVDSNSIKTLVTRVAGNIKPYKVSSLSSNIFRFYLEDVHIKRADFDLALGNFDIQISRERRYDAELDLYLDDDYYLVHAYTVENNKAIEANGGRTYYHPHLDASGKLCQGTYEEELTRAFTAREFDTVINLVREIMSSYNHNDCEAPITAWLGHKCAECLDYVKEYRVCATSGQYICYSCATERDPISGKYHLAALYGECSECEIKTTQLSKSVEDGQKYCTKCIEEIK